MLRLSALVIVLVTAIGLWKKAWLPEKHCIRAGFFVYYTHLSNLLILLYELALGTSGHDPHCGAFRWLSSPGVALSIFFFFYVCVFFVFWVGVGRAAPLPCGIFQNSLLFFSSKHGIL